MSLNLEIVKSGPQQKKSWESLTKIFIVKEDQTVFCFNFSNIKFFVAPYETREFLYLLLLFTDLIVFSDTST